MRAGYVKTISSAQGAPLNRIAVDLRTDCFAHGQLAVTLSRVRSRKDLLVLTMEEKFDESGHALTKNVVYKEILLYLHAMRFITTFLILYAKSPAEMTEYQ